MKSISFFAIFLLAGCTASKLSSSWTAPSAGSVVYKKIMVVSIISNEDSVLRGMMEQHMVNDLKTIGYQAVAYTNEFKSGEFRQMRYDSVKNRLSKKGIDGVVTIHLMAKEKENIYVSDAGNSRADNLPMGGFWERPSTDKQAPGKLGGRYVTSTQYYWESNFYDISSLALLYSVKSTAFEVASAQSLAHKYGKLIVDDMQKHYLLTAKK